MAPPNSTTGKEANVHGLHNEILDHIEKEVEISQDPDHVVWRFTKIVAHEGPLNSTDPSYKGSRFNDKVL